MQIFCKKNEKKLKELFYFSKLLAELLKLSVNSGDIIIKLFMIYYSRKAIFAGQLLDITSQIAERPITLILRQMRIKPLAPDSRDC